METCLSCASLRKERDEWRRKFSECRVDYTEDYPRLKKERDEALAKRDEWYKLCIAKDKRAASLIQERDEYKSKGELLCCQMGNLMLERDELRNYFDDEEQRQTFGHLIRENASLKAELAQAKEDIAQHKRASDAQSKQFHSVHAKLATARTALEMCGSFLDRDIANLSCTSRQRDLPENIWEHAMYLRDVIFKARGEIG